MRNWAENQIKIVMIRHGATPSNKEHRYLGKTEEGLSENGRESLLEKKQEKKYPELSLIFTSPMCRCQETAELLYPEAVRVPIAEWKEMDFGDFEGKNYLDLKEDSRYQEWIDSGGILPFPNGESRSAFVKRCEKGLEHMMHHLEKMERKGPCEIGMVVHGGTIMALLSTLCQGEYFDYQVANGEGYECTLEISGGTMKVIDVKKL